MYQYGCSLAWFYLQFMLGGNGLEALSREMEDFKWRMVVKKI